MGLPNKKPPIRISFPKLKSDHEATVIDLRQETDALASWPTDKRIRALQRMALIINPARHEPKILRNWI
jgi:hypothetical protein